MFFQIKEIILWSKNPAFKPRRLHFELGKVNIISGASKTGKSAIIPIIDFCLGAGKCRIPSGIIRDACEWFGILVYTDTGQKLFARREPASQKSIGDMFVLEGKEITIPENIDSKNTRSDAVKQSLDYFAGLTSLDFNFDKGGSGFKARPSFRDLAAFIFQPQNVVANPDILFYKSDTYEHREKLRTIFPYVLNAITPNMLAKQHELSQLSKELKRKRNELETIKQVSERWMAEIKAKVSEAKELGFLKKSISPNANRDELIDMLKDVVSTSGDKINVTKESVDEAVHELIGLQDEESRISNELVGFRRRLAEMSALRQSTIQFRGTLQIQRDRLKISQWMHETQDVNNECPLCGNLLAQSTQQLDSLINSLREIEIMAGEFDNIPAAFDREFERVRSEIDNLTEKLRGIRIRRDALQRSSGKAKASYYDSLEASRFIGGLEQSLETYARIGKDSELTAEVQELSERIKVLETEISEAQVRSRTKRALMIVSSNAEKLLPSLDVENPSDPVTLLIEDLTIKVGSVSREDYLWEIGSGSNWLSYHLAISLGLQQFFLSQDHNPVPSFIVYDQPSQVYFPKRMANRRNEIELDPKLPDEDIVAVQKAFQVISAVVQASMGELQVIVLDHAPENVWGNIPGIHLVEEWREGKALIPKDWL
jgi:hypothetical protein